ncbi:MAG: cmtD [Rhodoferax sp.]|nr:cmtD [Rhodoferax sp.]
MTRLDDLATTQRLVRTAARGLARTGLVHAYGHCSQRLDTDRFLVCAARPMGLIAAGEDGTVIDIHQPLPAGVLGEVRLHQQIYRRRPEVRGIVRSMPPALMALGTARRTPAARHGMGAYFGADAALWDDPQLVRDDERAAAVADTLGTGVSIVMRGNGAVVAADSLVKATVLTWYLEDAARLELQVLAAGLEAGSVVLTTAERQARATDSGAIFERMWQFITAGDPEN